MVSFDVLQGKWLPFHTFAASGEFFFARSLLKHIVDVNLPDKVRLTSTVSQTLHSSHFSVHLTSSSNAAFRI